MERIFLVWEDQAELLRDEISWFCHLKSLKCGVLLPKELQGLPKPSDRSCLVPDLALADSGMGKFISNHHFSYFSVDTLVSEKAAKQSHERLAGLVSKSSPWSQ